ncbi:MAG: DUF5320 domain-containing protein [Candidatus Saccharimonadaceae bacterium]
MPSFNKRGPMGEGSMTGRKMGSCTNFSGALKNNITIDNVNFEKPIDEEVIKKGIGHGFRNGCGRGAGQGREIGAGKGLGRGMGKGMGKNGGGGMRRIDGVVK